MNWLHKIAVNIVLKIVRSKVKDRIPYVIAYCINKAAANGQGKAEIMNKVDKILREG